MVAREPSQVAAAISAVEAAAGQGLWAAGFVSYEAAPGLDPALRVRAAEDRSPFHHPPLVWFGLFDRRVPAEGGADRCSGAVPRWRFAGDPMRYRRSFDRIRDHIAAGDTYQLNLTGRWAALVDDPLDLYYHLVHAQRPAYAAYVDTGRHAVASASPELFFEWRDHRLTSRPMKGTAVRGRWSEEDRAAGLALTASTKDNAENVMIVDLVRNDVGRVAEYGSVEVRELCGLERYPTLWQMASTVTARTRPATSLLDIFRALFPCGSVTGAPKCRSMELIAAFEGDRRGVYCGAVGYVGPAAPGVQARFNVAIRTAVVDRSSGQGVFGSGGGIVWESDPESEFAELQAKARILAHAERSGRFDLLETMAFLPGSGLRHRDHHLDRMAASAAYFRFEFSRVAALDCLGRATQSLLAPARARLTLASTGALDVTIGPLPCDGGQVLLAIDEQPVRSSDVGLFHKTTDRRAYDDRRARHPDADDVVLVNERGEVTETTIANLAARIDGVWSTPPLDAGCLPGVERARWLAGGTLVERVVTADQLRSAEEVAVLSSLRGWRPAAIQ